MRRVETLVLVALILACAPLLSQAEATGEDAVLITVRHAETDAVLPDLRVEMFPFRPGMLLQRPGRPQRWLAEKPVWHGTTDSEGRLRVPARLPARLEIGSSPYFGSCWIDDPLATKKTIRVRPRRTVKARVIDEQGRPRRGIGIAFKELERSDSAGEVRGAYAARSRAPDGVADITRRRGFFQTKDGSDIVYSVEYSLASKLWGQKPLTSFTEPGRPYATVVLPRHARVGVEVRTRAGGLFDVPTSFVLHSAKEAAGGGSRLWRAGYHIVESQTGQAEFSFVPLGVALRVTAFPEGFQAITVEVPAIDQEDRGVDLALTLGQPCHRARLRLLDETGQPLSNHRVRAIVGAEEISRRRTEGGWIGSGGLLMTDESGGLEVPVDRGFLEDAPAVVHCEVLDREGYVVAAMEAPLPADLSADRSDLGVCRPTPRFMNRHGRVVDESGQPLAGVRVQAGRCIYPEGFIFPGWSGLQSRVATVTDDRGRFRLYCWPGMGVKGLQLWKRGYETVRTDPDGDTAPEATELVMKQPAK